MNAIMHWITEHFSLKPIYAYLSLDGGNVSWLVFDTDWAVGRFYSVTFALAGFGACITFLPSEHEDDDFADMMANASVVLTHAEHESLKAAADWAKANGWQP